MTKKIIASFCCLLFVNSTFCVLSMGVDNRSTKKAVVSFRFQITPKSGQIQTVDGKLEVPAGKFKEWREGQGEEEKKEATVILSFVIGKKKYQTNENGKYWFLQINGDKGNVQPTLLKLFDSLNEEAGRPNSLVVKRISEFSGGNHPLIKQTANQVLRSSLINR